jgi:pilus assembly protein CpaE
MALFGQSTLRVVTKQGSAPDVASQPVLPSAGAAKLKILLFSGGDAYQDEIRESLARLSAFDEISSLTGTIGMAAAAVEKTTPDVLVLEGFAQDRALLGMVERITAHNPQVAVILVGHELASEFLIDAMRAGVREIVPFSAAHVALLESVDRVRRRVAGAAAGRARGQVLSFVSSKGGSGATFLAANLGYALATEADKRVILIDLNLPFGEAEIYVANGRSTHNLGDLTHEMHRLDGSLLESVATKVTPKFGVLSTPEDASKSAEIGPEHVDRIIDVAAREFDFVLLDVSSSPTQTTIRALDKADQIFTVIQNTLPFIRGAQRQLSLFRTLGYGPEKLRLLVNRYDARGEIGLAAIEKTLALKAYFTVPNSFRTASSSVNQGIPVLLLAKRDPISKALGQMAGQLVAEARTARTQRQAG